MDNQIKTIVFNDLKIAENKRYLVMNVLLILFTTYFLHQMAFPTYNLLGENNYFFQFVCMFLSIFIIFFTGTLVLQEFTKERLNRLFEVILTSPISLLKLYWAKLISLFILMYSTFIIGIVIFIVLSNYSMLEPLSHISTEVWVMSLLVIPLYGLLFYSVALWLILRFKNANIVQIISVFGFLLIFLVSYTSKNISNSLINLNSGTLITYPVLILTLLGVLIGFSIISFVIKNFNKEKIVV